MAYNCVLSVVCVREELTHSEFEEEKQFQYEDLRYFDQGQLHGAKSSQHVEQRTSLPS